MSAEQIILSIAVNLSRLSRWSSAGNIARIRQFLRDTDAYVKLLDQAKVSKRFQPTLSAFKKEYRDLVSGKFTTYEWAERTLTWANILQHRAKLA